MDVIFKAKNLFLADVTFDLSLSLEDNVTSLLSTIRALLSSTLAQVLFFIYSTNEVWSKHYLRLDTFSVNFLKKILLKATDYCPEELAHFRIKVYYHYNGVFRH
jgi:hypothetical protein